MTRKLGLVVLAVAIVVMVTASFTPASLPPQRIHIGWLGTAQKSAEAIVKPTVTASKKQIHVIFTIETFAFNSNPEGFDELVVSGPLRNVTGSKDIGFFMGLCSITNPELENLAECELTANFGQAFPAGSQLTIQGPSSDATHWFNAITGGTGKFADADGELEARNLPTGEIDLIFRLDDKKGSE